MAQSLQTLPDAEHSIDGVFLTPRVVDQRAFEEYSTTLKDLIREASGRGQALKTAVGDVKVLGDNLRQATKEIAGRLETAVKVMPTLEQRLGKAEQVLQLASDRTKLAEHLERTLEGLISEKLVQAETRIAQMFDGLEKRLDDARKAKEERINALVAIFESQIQTRMSDWQERLSAQRDRAMFDAQAAGNKAREEVTALASELRADLRQATTLREAIAKETDSAQSRLTTLARACEERLKGAALTGTRRAEAAQEQLQQAVSQVSDYAKETETRVTEAARAAEERLAPLVERTVKKHAQLQEHAEKLVQDLDANSRPHLEKLGQLCERAEAIGTRLAQAETAGPGSLVSVLEKIETFQQVAAQATSKFEEARSHADAAHASLAAATDEASRKLVAARSEADSLQTSFTTAAGDASRTVDAVESRAAAAAENVQGLMEVLAAAENAQEVTAQRLADTIALARQALSMIDTARSALAASGATGNGHHAPDTSRAVHDVMDRLKAELTRP